MGKPEVSDVLIWEHLYRQAQANALPLNDCHWSMSSFTVHGLAVALSDTGYIPEELLMVRLYGIPVIISNALAPGIISLTCLRDGVETVMTGQLPNIYASRYDPSN
jgi:hypothetical protein